MIGRAQQYLAGQGLGPTLVKAVIGSAGLRIVGMGFGFLVGVQLARGLGVEGYGIYGVAMSILALLTVPIEFGLPQLLTREVAAAQVTHDWDRLHGILRWSSRTVLLMSMVLTISVIGWLLITKQNIDSPLVLTLVVGLLMVPLVALRNLRGATLRGLQQIVKGQLPDAVICPAAYSVLLFCAPLLAVSMSPALAMSLGTVSAAIAFVAAAMMLQISLPVGSQGAIPRTQPKAWVVRAFPMALTEGMRVLQGHLITLLLGVISTVATVGVFRVASSFSLLVAVPSTLFNVVVGPVISRLYTQGDKGRLQRMLGWTAAGMTFGALTLTLPFLVAGHYLITKMVGVDFGGSNAPLLILCAGAIASAAFGAGAVLLNMTGHERRVTRASAISVMVMMLLAVPLIFTYSSIGAAIASAVATGLWCALMWLDARRLLGLDTSLVSILSFRFLAHG